MTSEKQIWRVLRWIFIFSIALSITFIFVGCRNKNKTSSEITNISGTYYGANGSILTLLPDKTAYYYRKDFSSANTDASWLYVGDTLTVSLPRFEDKIVMVTATATVDSDNISSFELSSLNPFWENETYKRISSDTKQHTKAEYDEMINKNQ
jgi:hypothetical protein